MTITKYCFFAFYRMESSLSSATDQSPTTFGGNHCQYFVVRKKRYCRMTLKAGYNYCGEHLPSNIPHTNDNSDEYLRVPCPLDPTQLIN